jgi:hypothetical protein
MTEPPQRRRNHAIWVGALLALIGAFSYPYTVQFPTLRDFPWLNLPLVVAGAIVSGIGFWRTVRQPSVYRGKILGGLGAALSVVIAAFMIYGIFFITRQMPAPTETAMSLSQAPDFTLMNLQGQPVRLSDYRGKKVVLAFYRGYW